MIKLSDKVAQLCCVSDIGLMYTENLKETMNDKKQLMENGKNYLLVKKSVEDKNY